MPNDDYLFGEKGFILKNETLVRFQPIGVTWDDSYCRRITDSGPSGCFIDHDFFAIRDSEFQEYNCSVKGSLDSVLLTTTNLRNCYTLC